MRYRGTRTSSSLGRGAPDSAQKPSFQCSLAQRGQPHGFLPCRCHGTRAPGQAAVPGQRHSPSHAASQEAHSKALRPRVLKFKLIFSIHVRGWEKAAESECRGEVPPGGVYGDSFIGGKAVSEPPGYCDLQQAAGLALGSHSILHERFLSHLPKTGQKALVLCWRWATKGSLPWKAEHTPVSPKPLPPPLEGTRCLHWEVTHGVALHPTSVLPSSLAQQPDLSASRTPSGHQSFLLQTSGEEGGIMPRRRAGLSTCSHLRPINQSEVEKQGRREGRAQELCQKHPALQNGKILKVTGSSSAN